MCKHVVEADGRVLHGPRDPPGQRSVYIPPGDVRREIYRLATFAKYPEEAVLQPWDLVKAGFYYMGYKDRVRCSSCGMQVEDWLTGDDPVAAQWHEVGCLYDRSDPAENIHVGEVRSRERPRGSVAQRERLRLQNNESGQRQQARAAGETCYKQVNSLIRPVVSQGAARRAGNGITLWVMFPCENPVNPHMASTLHRMQTFHDNLSRWNENNIRASASDMVEAGLYYLGQRDRVKCWYCNGGLQNWHVDDNPWFEHAKWFPTCEYVLQNKGPEYVYQVTQRFPNLNRSNLAAATQRPRMQEVVEKPLIVDPRNVRRRNEEKVEKEMQTSEIVWEAKNMGFAEQYIREAVKARVNQFGRGFGKLATLVDDLLVIQEQQAGKEGEKTKGNSSNNPVMDLKEILQEMCRLCGKKKVVVVLLPCGHLALCELCQDKLSRCPICQVKVEARIRTFRV